MRLSAARAAITESITTAPAGTVFPGGFTVDSALGDKIIYPYGDFMLHNIGTGDGIVQNGGAGTRNMVRTAPLWGLFTRTRLMHDGESHTITEAIKAHKMQAAASEANFVALNPTQTAQLLTFLNSL